MLHADFSALEASQPGLHLSSLWSAWQVRAEEAINWLLAGRYKAGAWTDWLNLANQKGLATQVQQLADEARHRFSDMVVLGIGGSSLGGYALIRALAHPYWNLLPAAQRDGWLRYHFVENVDADQLAGLNDLLDWQQTLVVVITKSGSTAETMSALMWAKDRIHAAGGDPWTDHIIAITDPARGQLRQLVNDWGIRSLPVPADVGGRFSVFSPVGLFPAALCGIAPERLLAGIRSMELSVLASSFSENPAAQAAVVQAAFNEQGKRISVFMPYSAQLASVADWYVQLWAESLGKKLSLTGEVVYAGQTPVKAVGVTDQHSQVQLFNEGPNDKVLTFVQVGEPNRPLHIPAINDSADLAYLSEKPFHQLLTAELDATRASLTRNQRPNWVLQLPRLDAEHVAQLLFFLEVQTALTGYLMGVDPFDQPGVELGKQYTYGLMGKPGFEYLLNELKPFASVY